MTKIFDVVQEEGQTARFRELFRMTIEPALENQLGQQCGDRFLPSKHGAAGLLTLDYTNGLNIEQTLSAAC